MYIPTITSDSPLEADLALTGAEVRACHEGAPAQETLFKLTAEVVFLPWENCRLVVFFFPSPAFLEQIRQGCCRGQDARPDGAACPGKSPICY